MYAQLILEDPAIASHTEFSRRLNTKLMALINSRDATGRIRILTSSTTNVYPGSSGPPLPYFGAGFVSPEGGGGVFFDTPGNPNLVADLIRITKLNLSAANFDTPTLELFDQNINLLTPSEWVQLAKDLKLDVRPSHW